MTLQSIPAYAGFRSRSAGQAYNEAAFHHFLAIDRRRAERATRAIQLVLVSIRHSPGAIAKLTDATAGALFHALGESIREVDFMGWYREGHVAAAVLAQGVDAPGDAPQRMVERLRRALGKRLSAEQSKNLRVRVVRLGGRVRKS